MQQVIDRTAVELATINAGLLSFSDELSLIDSVHTGLDFEAVDSFSALEWRRLAAEAMTPRPDHSNYATAGSLIRDVDSVSVLLAEERWLNDPPACLAPRYQPAIVSVPRISIAALSKVASDGLAAGTWVLKVPKYDEREWGDAFSGYETVACAGDNFHSWIVATYNSGPLALNPLLARYTSEIGLELGIASGPEDWQSSGTLSEEMLDAKARPDRKYSAETFQEHLAWVRLHAELLCGDQSSRSKLKHHWRQTGESEEIFELTEHSVGLKRLDRRYGLLPGTVADLVVMAAILHDAGKLTKSWQQAVWRWQELKASRREHYPPGPDGDRRYAAAQRLLELRRRGRPVVLAHTDYDQKWQWPDGQREPQIERQFPRPNHALEGAWLAASLVETALQSRALTGNNLIDIGRCALAAISTHHTPGISVRTLDQPPVLAVTPDARAILLALVRQDPLLPERPSSAQWRQFFEGSVQIRPTQGIQGDSTTNAGCNHWDYLPLYWVLARSTRLSDQRGTRLGTAKE